MATKFELRKELKGFTKEQLIELIEEMYSARKEIKEYLSFYLHPDSSALRDKYLDLLWKEMRRKKRWGRSGMRVSTIKSLVKEFLSFSPDADAIASVYLSSIVTLINLLYVFDFTESQSNLIKWFATCYLELGEKHFTLEDSIAELKAVPEKINGRCPAYALSAINTAISEYIEKHRI